ncbi:MAG: T9SS type A sorting domain-containing protein, partial [Bacteroidales bacterium]|nr:T9SS type A sorting domain-containing protein [Bacteroidales bacterium]
IVFLEKQESWHPMYIYCWRYTLQSGLTTLWQHRHDDSSGQTGITLFDFNQDDIMELVYRDSDNLRIINGSGKSNITGNDTIRPYNIYTRMMAAGTGCEYPIVADVNGDGSAEILVSGMLDQYANLPGVGGLHMFGNPGNWAPARPVWNQYMYHVTNVNEDLTIPTYCFNKATVFTAPDGTIRRPYNNFLQQAYYINQYGEPYNPSGYLEVNVNGTGCNAYTFHGVNYNESGLFEQLVESPDGCDTLYHIEVNLGSTSVYDWWQTACNSFTWNGITYTEPGDYTQEFSISNCDSIVHLHLSFAGQPEAIPEITGPTEVNVGTNLIVGQYFYHIDPVPLATHYEWTLEGADWIMDTIGTHCSLLITTPGSAVLKVRAWNDCGDTEQEIVIHGGFFDVNDHQTIPVALYPNPTNDKATVEAEGIQSIKVYDMWGQLLRAMDGANASKVEISLHDLATAIYTVEVLTQHGKAIKKLSVVK